MSYALSDSNGDDRAAKGKSQPGPQQRGFDACGCPAKHIDHTRVQFYIADRDEISLRRYARGLETLKAVIRSTRKREASSHPSHSGSAPATNDNAADPSILIEIISIARLRKCESNGEISLINPASRNKAETNKAVFKAM
jgi:hypothetical protein